MLREQGVSPLPVCPGRAVSTRCIRRVFISLLIASAVLGIAGVVTAQAEPPPEVTIDQLHLFLVPAGDRLQVSEYYLLGNAGDTAYDGYWDDESGRIAMVFPLPDGAANVLLGEDTERLLLLEDGIAYTRPISPGVASTEVRFAYELPLSPSSQVSHALPLPVAGAVLLVSGDEWQLEGADLTALGPMEMGDQLALAYTFEPSSPADEISFSVVPVAPSQAAQSAGPSSALVVSAGLQAGVGALAVLVAIVVSIVIWRSEPQSQPPASVQSDLQAIANLDERFAAGAMTASEHTKAREALKRRILQTLRDEKPADWDLG